MDTDETTAMLDVRLEGISLRICSKRFIVVIAEDDGTEAPEIGTREDSRIVGDIDR